MKGVWISCGDWLVGVDWNEWVINVYGGGWNYVFNYVGIFFEKIVGSVVFLVYELEEYKFSWVFFIGDMLIVLR